KQKAQSKDWAFLRLCHPGRVPACPPPGGAALTWARGLAGSVARRGTPLTTGNAPQYYCLCNQASLPPPDTVN
ncbi:hypothetical protein ELE31_26180, partial [Klebsiella quasipneumoniae]|nr:hypothetical protein [Klebsiella quasipneumoniae]MBM5569702.1 hypothetical protein [Klebsiella quasipneumoniae]